MCRGWWQPGGTAEDRPDELAAIWTGFGLTATLIALLGFYGRAIEFTALGGLAAALLGLGFFAGGSVAGRGGLRLYALAWWVGALGIFLWPGPHNLLVLVGLVVLLQVAPAFGAGVAAPLHCHCHCRALRRLTMTRTKRMLSITWLVLAVGFASTSVLFAQGAVKQTVDVVGQGPGGPVVSADGATLIRTKDGVTATINMPTPVPRTYAYPPGTVPGIPEVFTGWFFFFNQPENCAIPNQCIPPPPGAPAPNDFTTARGGVYNFAGHAVSGGGSLTLVGHISVGEQQFGGPFALEDPAGAEIHLAVAPHGLLVPEQLPDQLNTPAGSPPFWWLALFAAPNAL